MGQLAYSLISYHRLWPCPKLLWHEQFQYHVVHVCRAVTTKIGIKWYFTEEITRKPFECNMHLNNTVIVKNVILLRRSIWLENLLYHCSKKVSWMRCVMNTLWHHYIYLNHEYKYQLDIFVFSYLLRLVHNWDWHNSLDDATLYVLSMGWNSKIVFPRWLRTYDSVRSKG